MEDNLYAYTLYLDDGFPIKDTLWAKSLKEAVTIIDNIYGLSDENLKHLEIERMKKGN